ncbi:MAG: hypothetical protein AAF432_12380 [Planctomycetota bacterium]
MSDTPKLTVPPKNPHNIQATKRYIFNETGNIMVASTELASEQIAESVRDVFAEVSVFFAAMTKAMSTTINPRTRKPYSIYNYNAIRSIIDGSGLFAQVTEEDVEYESDSFGMTFSKELIEAVLGLATGEGELSFASAMVSSIGSAGFKIGSRRDSTDKTVANIIFVCEYLLGMPIVSAIVVRCDTSKHVETFRAGPCVKGSKTSFSMKLHKDTYMFVTPRFIKEYAGDLDSAEADLKFAEFVDFLRDLVENKPNVQVMKDMKGNTAPEALKKDTTYAIMGEFFGDQAGTLKFLNGDGTLHVAQGEWSRDFITFSVSGTQSTLSPIAIFAHGDTTTPLVTTPTAHTIDEGPPHVDGIFHGSSGVSTLQHRKDYTIKGLHFGTSDRAGELSFVNAPSSSTAAIVSDPSNWSDTAVTFQVTGDFSAAGTEKCKIRLTTSDGRHSDSPESVGISTTDEDVDGLPVTEYNCMLRGTDRTMDKCQKVFEYVRRWNVLVIKSCPGGDDFAKKRIKYLGFDDQSGVEGIFEKAFSEYGYEMDVILNTNAECVF